MEVLENKIDFVKAIVRLYEFCSTKKFHLMNKIDIDDKIGKLAIKINNEISKAEGINIFEAKNNNDLIKYEKLLNTYNFNFARNNFKYVLIGDDIEFLNKISPISTDTLKNYTFNFDANLKRNLQELKITIPTFNSYLSSPNFIELYESDKGEVRLFFITIKILDHGKENVLMVILSYSGELEVVKRSNSRMLTGNHNNILISRGVFLIKNESFFKNISKPAKLFLSFLERYGMNINLGNKTKRLFIEEFIDNNDKTTTSSLEKYLNTQIWKSKKNHQALATIIVIRGVISHLITGFVIDFSEYLNDLRNGRI